MTIKVWQIFAMLTALATPPIASEFGPYSIAISADGSSVYATNDSYGSNTISMYKRD